MRIYLLYDYDEDGPDSMFATTDYEKLPALLVQLGYTDSETLGTLHGALADIRREIFRGPYGLTRGWGGAVLHMLDVE